MLPGHQRITWRRNIGENFNRLSRVHERYRRQTTDRQTETDGQRHTANMNMSSRSLKTTESGPIAPQHSKGKDKGKRGSV